MVSIAAASSGVAGGERSSTAARVLHLLNDSTKWAVSLIAGGVLFWRRDAETMWCLLGAVAASFLCQACTAFVASSAVCMRRNILHCVCSVRLWLCLLSPYTVTPPAARPVQSLSSPSKGVPTEFQHGGVSRQGLKLTLKHQRPARARKADPGMPSSHANSLAFLATSAALALLRPSGAQAGQSALLAALPLLPAAFLVRPPRRADAYHASACFELGTSCIFIGSVDARWSPREHPATPLDARSATTEPEPKSIHISLSCSQPGPCCRHGCASRWASTALPRYWPARRLARPPRPPGTGWGRSARCRRRRGSRRSRGCCAARPRSRWPCLRCASCCSGRGRARPGAADASPLL